MISMACEASVQTVQIVHEIPEALFQVFSRRYMINRAESSFPRDMYLCTNSLTLTIGGGEAPPLPIMVRAKPCKSHETAKAPQSLEN